MKIKELKELLSNVDENLEICVDADSHNYAYVYEAGVGIDNGNHVWVATDEEDLEAMLAESNEGYGPSVEKVFVIKGS